MVSAHHVSIYIHVGWGGVCTVFNFLTILRATASCTSISRLTGHCSKTKSEKTKVPACRDRQLKCGAGARRVYSLHRRAGTWVLGHVGLAWEDCGIHVSTTSTRQNTLGQRATTRPRPDQASTAPHESQRNVQSSNANRRGSRRRRALGV